MTLWNIHVIDLAVVACYLVVIVILGRKASPKGGGEEGFFLAGRKLGKWYQFFLNFGNATDSSGAVSISTLIYQSGVSGIWLQFQTIFMNPYYWFMNMWFRRARMVTTADLFEARFGGRMMGRVYAVSQLVMAVTFIGFGNFLGYKLVGSLVTKPETTYSTSERVMVADYREWRKLEEAKTAGTITASDGDRLDQLRARAVRKELTSYVPAIGPIPFYLICSLGVAAYIMYGGMAAVAANETLQGFLLVVFSGLLIPFGISELGGWDELSRRVPPAFFELFQRTGTGGLTFTAVLAILLVSFVQINAVMGNMGISGSARNEFSARFGAAAGIYAKRLVLILWSIAGLIGVALYSGADALSDPEAIWGMMSKRLLGPGLLGLMLAGALAGKMSVLSNQAVAISALMARNVYRDLHPGLTEAGAILAGRVTIMVVLALGIVAALWMNNVAEALKLLLLINVPFGAAILMIFCWRRLTAAAVWTSVTLSTLLMIVVPAVVPASDYLRTTSSLTRTGTGVDLPTPLFFESVVPVDPLQPRGALEGRGRFNAEVFLLDAAGLDVSRLNRSQLLSIQFCFDALFPFVVLVLVSTFTQRSDLTRVARFYGVLKTPVGATPEAERAAIEETVQHPDRFDHLKLWPRSQWEFTRWDRVDTIGFLGCCAFSGAILAGFWLVLRALSRA